ncbi:EamA domain [Dillenia turbinata]|uniref:EamA domain n=1 Tax=Dillenia turbinata TaxID=194707 RepID=A0AAN8VCU3_9MAGN
MGVGKMSNPVVISAMIAMECLQQSAHTLNKAAVRRGMNQFVYVVYSGALAFVFLLLATFFHYRKRSYPQLTFRLLGKISLLGFSGCCTQIFMTTGIKYSSPTFAAVMTDLTPAFTFILAILFGFPVDDNSTMKSVVDIWLYHSTCSSPVPTCHTGTRGAHARYRIQLCLIELEWPMMEKLDVTMRSSQARLIGTILSIGGALIVTLYKGPAIAFATLPSGSVHGQLQSAQSEWVIGGSLLAVACFLISLLIIIQAWITKDFPHILLMTTLSFFPGTALSALVAIVSGVDAEAWNLSLDMSLVACVSSVSMEVFMVMNFFKFLNFVLLISSCHYPHLAIFVAALRGLIHAWAVHQKGPIYVAMFRPVGIVIAAAMGITLLGDTLYSGSIFGAATIALGFYSVIWGQSKQEKVCQELRLCGSESSSNKVPLLQNKSINVFILCGVFLLSLVSLFLLHSQVLVLKSYPQTMPCSALPCAMQVIHFMV